MRQVLFQLVTQRVDIDLLVRGKVSAEVVLSVELANDDRNLFDMRLRGDQSFDLAQFDTQTSELDLVIQSAEDVYVAVFIPFGVVAGTVHARVVVFHKRRGGFIGQVLVALCHADTADVQLADHAVGRRIAEFIDNDLVVIEQRSADGDIRRFRQIRRVTGNGDLRRAVGVDDADIVRALADVVSERDRIAFAAGHDQMALGERISERLVIHVLLQTRWRGVNAVDAVLVHQLRERSRIVHLVLGGEYQRFAVAERRRMLLEGHIEGDGGDGKVGRHVVFEIVDMRVGRMRLEVIADSLMAQHDALGLSGRAGGIDHVAQFAVAHRYIGIFCLVAGEDIIHVDRLVRRIVGQLVLGGDDEGGFAVGDDMVDTVGRILRIAGDKRCACLVHAEQASEEAAFSRQQQRHAVACPDAPFDQVMGDDIGSLVEFAVGKRRVLGDQCGFVRVFSRVLLK